VPPPSKFAKSPERKSATLVIRKFARVAGKKTLETQRRGYVYKIKDKNIFLKKDVQKAVSLILKVPRLFVFTNFSHLLHKNFYLYSILLPSIK